MASTKMIAWKAMRYRTRMLTADDEFVTSGPDARLYSALGWARPVEATASKEPSKPQTKSKKRGRRKAKASD